MIYSYQYVLLLYDLPVSTAGAGMRRGLGPCARATRRHSLPDWQIKIRGRDETAIEWAKLHVRRRRPYGVEDSGVLPRSVCSPPAPSWGGPIRVINPNPRT